VATTDSSLRTPDREVFIAAGDAGTSENQPDRYLDDISDDKESANTPPYETTEDKNARRDRNMKQADRHRRLQEALPIRNLNEALDQVANWAHTAPEQCLMSITTIARQAQGHHAGEVIAKLAEDTYFMRVDNRVTQVPPDGNHEATSRSLATVSAVNTSQIPTALGPEFHHQAQVHDHSMGR
jgi:hypothetical protein